MDQKPTLRIGIVGSIGHVEYVLKGVRSRSQSWVVGVAPGPSEPNAEILVSNCSEAGHRPEVFASYRELLDKAHLDIVAVTCHFGDHARVNIDAVRRGIHVFSEKPVATTLAELDALEQSYRESDTHLSCMFSYRYDPAFLAAQDAVRDGAIGAVELISCQKSYKLGRRPSFYGDRTLYGGTIPWVGSHAIDWIRWFSGQEFESVFARHLVRDVPSIGNLETGAQCQFELSNGVLANVSIDYSRPETASGHGDDRIRVVGSKGIVEVRHGAALIETGTQIQTLPMRAQRDIFAAFINQVLVGGACLVSADDAFAATRASLLARQSADEGRVMYFNRPS